MYDYQTLTLTNIDGSISPFSNGASGLILLGTGTSTPPAWTSLADAGIATKQYVDDTFLKLTGGTLTGALTGTSASFSGGVTATGGFTGDLTGTASNAAKVANALSIQLGTGTAESYDGSAAKSFVITPSAIGAKPDFSWPSAGLMTSTGTSPSSIAWPDTSATGFHLLVTHTGAGNHAESWKKFSNAGSSDVGILSWQGSGENLNFNLINTTEIGNVLARTSNGYEFVALGQTTVPPINQLQCATSGTTIANDMFLKAGANPSDNPSWDHITASNIYGADNGLPSVLISQGEGTGTATSTGNWLPTNTLSTTPQILAALSGSNNGLRFYNPSALGLASVSGLSDGIAKISSGALTSGAVALGGSEVSGTLGVSHGGTGLSTLGTAGQLLVVNSGATALGWANSAPKADTLTTPRTLTIGNTGHTFDGSADVSWSQNEIGFASGQTASFTFTQTGWYRIAIFSSRVRRNIANFKFFGIGNNSASGDFVVSLNGGQNPQINLISFSRSAVNTFLKKARIVYSDASGMESYLEIYVEKGTLNISINFEMFAYSNIELLSTATQGSDESASNYNVLEYEFFPNAFGDNGQFLKTNKSTSGRTTTVSTSWQTLTIPAAPSSLPLVDNENGALGTSGTYANADHQHPLPYAVQAAYKFYYPRKLGIGGAITAEAQEYDGTADLILQVTEIDPNAIISTVPIEKGGTGASTASAALTNLGAAASNHNHDGTYLKLSGGNMTGTINIPANITPLNWAGKSGVATFVSGDLTAQDNVNSYVTGRRQNINLYDSDISSDSASPTTINHTAKNDTTVNIVCGINEVRRYTRYINLPTPTADMLGDTITVYFTNQKPSVIAELFATCSTNYRIKSYDYSNFGNTAGVDANCKWSSGNVVQFTCINLENNGTTYYWRAVKLVEQSW